MKTIFTSLLIFGLYFVQAQLTITTNLREDGIFNEKELKWEITNTTEGLTVFSFNNELTSFRHSTGTISSMYTIDDWTYDDDEVLYDMIVTSDAGNEYDFMVDGLNELVLFFYYDDYGRYCMVRHYIQDSYFDE
jgi:hypothetical protein